MVESFPYRKIPDSLEQEDFTRFSVPYTNLFRSKIPFTGRVIFLYQGERLPKLYTAPGLARLFDKKYKEILSGNLKVAKVLDTFLFAFPAHDGVIVGILTKVDQFVSEKCTEDWLEEICSQLSHEFILIKKAYLDSQTGLLNSEYLFSALKNSDGLELGVSLIEIPSKHRSVQDSFAVALRGASALKAFTDPRFLIHYLGQGIFALLYRVDDVTEIETISSTLVNLLKKEGFYRVHIGSSSGTATNSEEWHSIILDQAWSALQEAERRGPFSFCDYLQLVNKDQHPLRDDFSEVVKQYRKLSRKYDRFSLIKLFLDNAEKEQWEDIQKLHIPTGSTVFSHVDDYYIFLPDVSGKEGLELAENLLKRLGHNRDTASYAGISCYPFMKFSKPDVLINARKAMLHAEFFGSGHAVLFDSVSLNISGDIYFGDGNLPKAVKEYTLGLTCDPEDVNLLNSLGVTYALLNRGNLARNAFKSALLAESDNFMALYNLGIDARQQGWISEALSYYEQAFSACTESEDNEDRESLLHELDLQLGQLYCTVGEHEKSIELLQRWYETSSKRRQLIVARYLGEAYLGLGEYREAMNWLQRALQFNEFDPEALSLLGIAVLKAGEGNDIAFSFCGKAVELEPNDPVFRVRFARTLVELDRFEECLLNLGKCKGKIVPVSEVRLLKARAYNGLGNRRRARVWAKKVCETEKGNITLKEEAELLFKSLKM